MYNTKEFPIGSVVYFVRRENYSPYRQYVWFGIVVENYPGTVCIELYALNRLRKVNGVLETELTTPTKWQKLPKGWSYDTKFLTVEDVRLYDFDEAKNIKLNKPEDILSAIEKGMLVKVGGLPQHNFEVEIDAKKGWRIVTKYDSQYDYYYQYSSINWREVYGTYEEAQKVIDDYEAELKRQSELSDLDWSIEQIDYILNRWAKIYCITDELKWKYRDWIMQLDRVEDVEIRMTNGRIQWKYWDKKRWYEIEI